MAVSGQEPYKLGKIPNRTCYAFISSSVAVLDKGHQIDGAISHVTLQSIANTYDAL